MRAIDSRVGGDELELLIEETSDGEKSAKEAASELLNSSPGYLSLMMRFPINDVMESKLDAARRKSYFNAGVFVFLLLLLLASLLVAYRLGVWSPPARVKELVDRISEKLHRFRRDVIDAYSKEVQLASVLETGTQEQEGGVNYEKTQSRNSGRSRSFTRLESVASIHR